MRDSIRLLLFRCGCPTPGIHRAPQDRLASQEQGTLTVPGDLVGPDIHRSRTGVLWQPGRLRQRETNYTPGSSRRVQLARCAPPGAGSMLRPGSSLHWLCNVWVTTRDWASAVHAVRADAPGSVWTEILWVWGPPPGHPAKSPTSRDQPRLPPTISSVVCVTNGALGSGCGHF